MAELNPQTGAPATVATVIAPAAAWSHASVASLACGIFLIVPFFTGLAAVVLGVIGIRQTNQSNLRGRRLAIAGAILGLVNIFAWTGYFEFIGQLSGPGRAAARLFIDDLNSANPAQAAGQCLSGIHSDRLVAASNQLKEWGGVKSVAVLHITSETADGITTGSVRGTLRTPTGDHVFQLQTVCQDNSNWKISDFSLQ